MFICQQLQQHPTASSFWRVIFFKVVANDKDQLVWQTAIDLTTKWKGYYTLRRGRLKGFRISGQDRAWKYLKHNVPQWGVVLHEKVTLAQAKKLTGIDGLPAFDKLREDNEPDNPVIQNFKKGPKPKPTQEELTTKEITKVDGKLEEIDRKLRRWQNLKKKYERRKRNLERKRGGLPHLESGEK